MVSRKRNFDFILIPAFCLILASASCPAFAQKRGWETIESLVQLFGVWAGDEPDRQIYDEAANFIDYEMMGQRAIGESQWSKLTPAQRKDFVQTFRKLIEERYYPRWHKIFRSGKLEYLNTVNASGDTLVRTELKLGDDEDDLIWRLNPRSGDLKIISLSVDNKDLLQHVAARFQRKLKKCDFTQFMKWLRDELDDDDDDNKAPS